MNFKKYFLAAILLVTAALSPLLAQPCDCLNTGNCPVPIQDNGSFQGTLDVTVNGANDLGVCPLTSVCFSITHTWVGDLAVTLTSPSGINYLVMADSNNGTGGCGTDSDNVDVCIVGGNFNPLTNNTEYICNTGACQSGTCCLVGNWTMPCGGVSDPITGANQAPNCDLNDFNIPGQPANGTWTLTVNDVCSQDVGTLNNFSLTFACGTSSCTVCAADGGTINDPDFQGCLGDPGLNLNIIPTYNGPQPNPGEYSYAWVISQYGNITAVNTSPNMSNQPPGTYTLCGFSYINTASGLLNTLVGMNLTTAINQFNSPTAPFCGDFSDDCMEVTIGPAIPPTVIDTALCIGECIEVGFQPVCASGSFTLTSYLGCDSLVNVNITNIPPVVSVQTVNVCQGECITVNNQQYCPPGPAVFTVPSWQGCDSTVTILFNEILTVAVINPSNPPPISCANPAITLDGSGSVPAGASLQWTGPGNFNSNQPFISVNIPGTYTLTVTNPANTPPCTAQASVDITGTVEAPDLQLNSAPPTICQGASFNLANLNIIDLNGTNPVLTYHSGTPATPANELMDTNVSPNTTTTYYVLGTAGACYDELPVTLTVNPTPVASFTVTSPICISGSSTVTFTGTAPTNATYNWNFGGGTATPGTGAGPHTVTWGTGGTKTITLQISASGCQSTTATQTVVVNTQIPNPVINCTPTPNDITFSWNPINGASGYNVTVITGQTGTQIDPTTYQVTNLMPNEQVTISVVAISSNACPNSSAQITCSAQDCPPITVTIDSVADICLTPSSGTIQLVASQMGGDGSGVFTWSGPGVNPITGVFNPANANPGANTISVSYEEGTCTYNKSIDINVFPTPNANFSVTSPICNTDFSTVNYTGNASNSAIFTWDFDGGTATPATGPGPLNVTWPNSGTFNVTLTVEEDGCQSNQSTQTINVVDEIAAPQITCISTTNSVEFVWNSIPGASGYDVNVINGGTGTATSDTSMLFTGLNPGDDVTIQVIALDAGPCGNMSSQFTCIAQNCPAVTITITPVPSICLNANATPVTLQATQTGGVGGGTWGWTGTGVSPSGVFDPQMANVGANVITASYTEGDCIYTKNITVTVLAQPVASFNAPASICINSNASISYTGTVSSGIQFAWNFGGGTANPGTGQGPHLVTWPTAGQKIITLTVTTAQGCVSEPFSDTMQVDPTLVAPVITCATSTTSIQFNWPDVNGGTNYQATLVSGSPGSQISQNAYLINGLMPGDQATISLTVTGAGACPPVTVQKTCVAQNCPPLNVTVNSTPSICVNSASPVQLAATVTGGTGAGSGTWSGTGVDSTGLFTAATAGVGTHVVTYVFTENNCTYSATGNVVVFSQPSAAFTATQVVCVNNAATVTYTGNASPTAAYNWDFGGGTAVPGTGPGPHQVTFPTPGAFDISLIVMQSGCASQDVINSVQVDPALTAPSINCTTNTQSIVFNWNTVPNANDYQVQVISGPTGSLSSQTSYTVNGLQPNDQVTIELTVSGNTACPPIVVTETCIAQDCPTVTIDLPPVSPICFGSTVGTMQLAATVTGGSGNGTGTWSGPGMNANGAFDPNAAGVGTHTITYVYQENANCSYDATQQVQVVAPPVADAGSDGKITCVDNQTSVQLGGNGSSTGPNITYDWSMTGGSFPGDSTILHPVVAEAGTYTLTVTNTALQGCSATDEVEVTSSQDIPEPQVSIVPVSCFGENDGAISVTSVTGGLPPYLYSLNGSTYGSTSSFQPLAPGVYEVSVIDASGCEASVTIDITQPQELNVELVAIIEGGGNIIRLGDTTELQALVSLPPDSLDNISWHPAELVSCDTCLNTFVSPTGQTTFTITVESNGCVDSDDLTLYVKKDRPVYVPNAFSPNGDGLNDVFVIYAGKQVKSIKSFLIFDRWGETVWKYYDFLPNDIAYGWDGTFRNNVLNTGVFTWFAEIEFVDGEVELYEGDVTILK